MDRITAWVPELAAVDILALAIIVLGVLVGTMRGLGPVFGMLLWVSLALWISSAAMPVVLGWMPNTADPGDPAAQRVAYGLLTAVLLGLPALARLLGGAAGKKKEEPEPEYKLFGVLVSVVTSLLLFTLIAPYTTKVQLMAKTFDKGLSPIIASEVAGYATWLYPEAHRSKLDSLSSYTSASASSR